jgi:hypothetical protein
MTGEGVISRDLFTGSLLDVIQSSVDIPRLHVQPTARSIRRHCRL